MEPRLCACGRPIYRIGARCTACQAEFTAARSRKTDHPFKRQPQLQEWRSPDHLAWIRTQPCAVPGCQGRSQAAHVRMNTGGGMGLKPSDRWVVPLCGGDMSRNWIGHHREQHQMGHDAFDAKYGLDLRALAEQLAAESPALNVPK